MMGLSTRAIFGMKPEAFLDEPEAVVPPIIILMYPMGGLKRSFSRRATCSCGESILSLLMNLCNFPYLIRVSICCFKS